MAKKQSLSYGPDMGLIAGEQFVAETESGIQTGLENVTSIIGEYQKQEEERAAKMEAYSADFPGLEQADFMANATNKQIVTDFLNTQRDEYVRLAAIHEKTKDRKVLDQMNDIKFSIANLDDQIKVFNQDKGEYRTAFDENQLANGKTYESDFFTNVYTDNAKFNITPSGDISFDIGGKKNTSKLYKDHAGNWNNRNNISEGTFLEVYSKAVASGEKGNAFYRDGTYKLLLSNLKATGNDGIQTFATTDLTGDNVNMSFEDQWASGLLDDKFYKNRGEKNKQNDSSWMFDNKNGDELKRLVADYYTDVVESGYNTGKKNYKDPNAKNGEGTGFLTTKDSVYSGNLKRYLKYNEAKKIYDNFKPSTEGKDTNVIIDDIRYNYSAKDNNWYYGEGDDKIDYGTPFDFLESMNISDPDFLSLTTGSSEKVDNKKPMEAKEKELKFSTFENAENVSEIFNAINDAYINKNENIRQQTGSAGGLKVKKSGQKIKLFEAGKEIGTFRLGGNYGFGLNSRSDKKRNEALSELEKLINSVNKSLNPEFISDEYNTIV